MLVAVELPFESSSRLDDVEVDSGTVVKYDKKSPSSIRIGVAAAKRLLPLSSLLMPAVSDDTLVSLIELVSMAVEAVAPTTTLGEDEDEETEVAGKIPAVFVAFVITDAAEAVDVEVAPSIS